MPRIYKIQIYSGEAGKALYAIGYDLCGVFCVHKETYDKEEAIKNCHLLNGMDKILQEIIEKPEEPEL